MRDNFNFGSEQMSIIPVMSIEQSKELREFEIPPVLEMIPLRNAVIFPDTVMPIPVIREKSLSLLNKCNKNDQLFGTITQIDPKVEDPKESDLFLVGTICRVIKLIDIPNAPTTAIIQGLKRFKIKRFLATNPYLTAEIEALNDIVPDSDDIQMNTVADAIKKSAVKVVKLSHQMGGEATQAIKEIEDNSFLVNFVATTVDIENPLDKMDLLFMSDIKERGLNLLSLLDKQLEILKLREDINRKVKFELDQQQREYYLNNQLKTIQEELGISSDDDDIAKFREMAMDTKLPQNVRDICNKEINKLDRLNPSSPDYHVQYGYIQFILELPWNTYTNDNMDLKNAQKVLDRDHYGIDNVKDRIIEFLSVLKLNNYNKSSNMKSPIICLYGPPGVGKTSLGESVAKALDREYGRISLGGLHDESEIRGHRRTYIGAMAGRILKTIKRCGTSNPVIILDEIDKVSEDFHGDPASALLEVLDPEQNSAFHDNYLDIDYDLSKVLFITTANDISTIQPALRDRMEMINVSGYLEDEKVEIATRHLIPKQLKAHGLKASQLSIGKRVLHKIVDEYTHESGVRTLDKQIAKIARITAKKIALEELYEPKFQIENLREYLGLPIHRSDIQKGNEMPGVVTGLAWTALGGEILFIECSTSNGKGNLTTTGNLGEVMKESAIIALQYLKANAKIIGVKPSIFYEKDIHIHVPEGAVPKDGPSAGITMTTAIASAITGKSIKKGIAMTGETTLRGKVLPVGGIKEKILAAKRAGVKTIILSVENKRDIEDIKEEYIKGLNFEYVETVDQVLKYVFSK